MTALKRAAANKTRDSRVHGNASTVCVCEHTQAHTDGRQRLKKTAIKDSHQSPDRPKIVEDTKNGLRNERLFT